MAITHTMIVSHLVDVSKVMSLERGRALGILVGQGHDQ